ncbi:MAG: hypothetical protein IPK67_00045 [Planctomycetes bacterium]|nr:hypothetical protein [Planctomycetota bacterium]
MIEVKKAREAGDNYELVFAAGTVVVPKKHVTSVEIEGDMSDYVPKDDKERDFLAKGFVRHQGKVAQQAGLRGGPWPGGGSAAEAPGGTRQAQQFRQRLTRWRRSTSNGGRTRPPAGAAALCGSAGGLLRPDGHAHRHQALAFARAHEDAGQRVQAPEGDDPARGR